MATCPVCGVALPDSEHRKVRGTCGVKGMTCPQVPMNQMVVMPNEGTK
ncbi:MAG: hypothetical protein LC750_07575 [Actinobacteria bacterium]|nr:hypothetical protein [Actinomycetota bacterium]